MDWPAFGGESIKREFMALGHVVTVFEFPQKSYQTSRGEELGIKIAESILSANADIVFSFNFFPIIATAVHACRKKYICWVYDSPAVLLFSMTVFLPGNYIFHFDSSEVERLRRDGVEHVWYLPMAADTEKYDELCPSEDEQAKYRADVAMIGSMYREKYAYFSKYTDFDDYLRGYLDGMVRVQEQLYGLDILESMLTPKVMEKIQRTVPIADNTGDSYDTAAWNFANYYLAMRVTANEREHLLQKLSEQYDVVLYTTSETPQLPRVHNMGSVEYYKEAPKAIKCARINLNVTLRSIHTGIPQRVMDIMGCGGFVLSNYQADMCDEFVAGQDFVYYESIADAKEKVGYFLGHEDERKQIALRGYRKVKEKHTYRKKIEEMLVKIR